MKARSLFVGFLGCPPGRHAAFLDWHDLDHRPENHGQIPHIFHSARWIVPPDSLSRREHDGVPPFSDAGEYFVTYWSTASPEQLSYDMTVLREQLAALGRCRPIGRDFTARWRERVHPVQGYVSPALGISADAAPFLPHDGLVVTVGQEPQDGGEWSAWYDRTVIPALLSEPEVLAAYTLITMPNAAARAFVHLHYVRGEPLTAQRRIAEALRDGPGTGPRIRFRGSYVPQHNSQPRFFE